MKLKVAVAGLDDPENKKPALMHINCLSNLYGRGF